MPPIILPLSTDHRPAVMEILNHYAEHSFSAYSQETFTPDTFAHFEATTGGYPSAGILDRDDRLLGFGILRPYHPSQTFARTAEIAYFLRPDQTRQGLGSRLLAHLEKEAAAMGIRQLLASVASLNGQSLAFHEKRGFQRVGQFRDVVTKMGRTYDVIWMQKPL